MQPRHLDVHPTFIQDTKRAGSIQASAAAGLRSQWPRFGFGPVVALLKYDDLDNALARANGLESAFQGAVFTQNTDAAMKIFTGLNGSTVIINDHTAFRTDWMPFAGLGPSEHGVDGIPRTIHKMAVEKRMVINSTALNGL